MNVDFTPEEAARALGGRVVGKNKVRAPSPGMPPADESLEIKFGPEYADGFTVNDYYSGDGDWKARKDFVRDRVGRPWEAKSTPDPVQRRTKKKLGPIIKTYDYTEPDGTLIYQVTRHNPKDFRQRMSDGNGGWIKSLDGLNGRRVLYRWPDLVKYPEATVFFCEGEKDTDRLASIGHCATTVASGAWTPECVDALKGRHVFILEDNDEKGKKRALAAATALHGVASGLRIVQLSDRPCLPDNGPDVSDWLDANSNDTATLVNICLAAPEWAPDGDAGKSASEDDFSNQGHEAPATLIKSSAEFIAAFIPPDYLLDGLMQRRFIYSMTAPTGAGKTAIALLIAAHIALKRPIGEYGLEGGRVLYLAGENPDDVRMRWLAMADQMDFDADTIDVHFLPGTPKLSEIAERIKAEVQKIGPVVLVVVDTSAAYFEGDDENGNVQMGAHARRMRALVTLPGEPCVLVACHPVKNATSDNMQPRGGGAFIAEIDGNLTVSKSDAVVTLHWQGKFRGPDFAPVPFSLHTVTTPTLKDSKGRLIPTVIAKPMSERERTEAEADTRSDEDALLIAIKENDRASMASLATVLQWLTKESKPYKARVQRSAERLKKGGYVKVERGALVLTEKGQKEAIRAKQNADLAGARYG